MRAPSLRGRVASRVAAAALAAAALSLALGDAGLLAGRGALPSARAEGEDEPWLAEFAAVCARTDEAMTIPTDELKALIRRCDALRPKVEALDPTRRKVYGRRLKTCRDLYAFVLESRSEG